MNRKGEVTWLTVMVAVAVVILFIVIFNYSGVLQGFIKFFDSAIPGFKQPNVTVQGVEILRFDMLNDEVEFWTGADWKKIGKGVEIGSEEVSRSEIYDAYRGFYYDRDELGPVFEIGSTFLKFRSLEYFPGSKEFEGAGVLKSYVTFSLVRELEGTIDLEDSLLNYDDTFYTKSNKATKYVKQSPAPPLVIEWRDSKLKEPMPLKTKHYCLEKKDNSLLVYLDREVASGKPC